MQQATDSGWYARDGAEIFIQKGTVRPDDHPDVLAVPALFEKLGEESAVPPVVKVQPQPLPEVTA